MLDLCDVLQLIVDSLYNCTFPQKNFIRNAHYGTLHVAFQFGYQLDSIDKQSAEQFLTDIPLVSNQFPVYLTDERFIFKRFPVINITRREHETQKFTFFIADEMQLEAEEPAHGTFAALRYSLENLMDMYPLVLAHSERGAVNETDARTLM